MLKNIKKRWKKAVNTDNVIDFSVDVGLIAFDVLASPILIVVRILPVSYTHLRAHET